MTPAAPSNGEIMRRLDELVTELRRLADTLQDAYVRKDVLTEMNNATSVQITGLEDELRAANKRMDKHDDRMDRAEEATDTNRRLVITSFVAPIVVAVVLALVLSAIGVHR